MDHMNCGALSSARRFHATNWLGAQNDGADLRHELDVTEG
jgi:hypothetical protein